jgi:hypothetical protein
LRAPEHSRADDVPVSIKKIQLHVIARRLTRYAVCGLTKDTRNFKRAVAISPGCGFTPWTECRFRTINLQNELRHRQSLPHTVLLS